jgi:hypothetical protein
MSKRLIPEVSPLKGLSTSTTGMVGVTERGPVNVPILVTSYGEYVRWFGARLNAQLYSNSNDPHCYLPQAVEGFFTNGGKRVFIVRVLDAAKSQQASTFLFDRGTAASAPTRLLRRVPGNSTDIVVADNFGLAPNQWLQIGAGAEVEYRQISAPLGPANEVTLRLPLAFSYNPSSGVKVDHFTAPGALVASPQLDAPVNPGATTIRVSGTGAIAGGTLLRLGTTGNGDEEFVIANAVAGAAPDPRDVTLRTPVILAHPGGAGNVVDILPALGAAVDTTTLSSPAVAGDTVLLVPTIPTSPPRVISYRLATPCMQKFAALANWEVWRCRSGPMMITPLGSQYKKSPLQTQRARATKPCKRTFRRAALCLISTIARA